jgi:hypothetical protein
MAHWVRVRDKTTGHQFDVDPSVLPHTPALELLNDERWPDLEGPGALPRPALAHVDKDGKFAPPQPPESPAGEAPPEPPAAKPGKRAPKTTSAATPADTTPGSES